jgi:hypothetical protein
LILTLLDESTDLDELDLHAEPIMSTNYHGL